MAVRDGKPFERQMQAFEALVANCVVLSFDEEAARVAVVIWSAVARRHRQLGDIPIASVALSRQLPLVTRKKRDFERLSKASASNFDSLTGPEYDDSRGDDCLLPPIPVEDNIDTRIDS